MRSHPELVGVNWSALEDENIQPPFKVFSQQLSGKVPIVYELKINKEEEIKRAFSMWYFKSFNIFIQNNDHSHLVFPSWYFSIKVLVWSYPFRTNSLRMLGLICFRAYSAWINIFSFIFMFSPFTSRLNRQ